MTENANQNTVHFLHQAARLLGLDSSIERILVTPRRELRVELNIVMDDGSFGHFI